MRVAARSCVLVVAFAVALACSSTATPAASVASAGAAKTNDVVAEGFTFKPAALDVAVGSKVTWTNKDAAQHTVTAGKPDAKQATFASVLDPGMTFTFTFDKAGTFAYFCERHTSMVATVTVK